ncbi:PepSY domain-containing protein [Mangrovimicrobium sediminis]|uniref:PepSY domain-containing protein n=1 Tax=Mangrovimicrobium sediminis TaxID=2562682 RepID=A0A4Z0M7S6_9GAMM|nr:PepSY-associated TM helix domain-containing protein [Haliea sp. SAOS-164]TGD75713.1 PepSY domain-containing protein [Haliea sp. SAOS-164]
MKFSLSPGLVRQSLASHSWLGLLAGAAMYLVCLSGTLAVFYPEFERWEQPAVAEFTVFDPALLEGAYSEALARDSEATEHVFIGLPSPGMPRASVSTDNGGWFVNGDGSLGEPVAHEWTHFLLHLHLYLHLPESFGMIVVSLLGALLCGLIVSGVLAHPRLFRDAFSLRLRGSKRMEQVDIHNRISVWGLPFHLMIAVTGAYFGLASLAILVIAQAYFDGDTDRVVGELFGPEPQLEQRLEGPAAVASAVHQVRAMAPEVTPIYVTLEEVGTPRQFIEVGAQMPERLIYSEVYRFDSAGRFIDRAGYSDGEAGRQAVFSSYRLHFGHFGGRPVQFAYLVLGLGLSVVAVTGINIWFARRKSRDALNSLWTGFVWGTPLALAASAVALVLLAVPAAPVFWLFLVACCSFSRYLDDDRRARRALLWAGAGAMLLLAAGHALKFGGVAFSGAALWVNVGLVLCAAAFALGALRPLPARDAAVEAAPEPA